MELQTTAVVAGGDALARADDGRTVLVEGALPGEVVRVEILETKKDLLRARTLEVVNAAPERVTPPCVHAREGCGGCPWQHVEPAAQSVLKQSIVLDSLRRLAHLDDPPLTEPIVLSPWGYRTTVRALVVDGRPAYRRRHAHDAICIDACPIAHPLVDEVLRHGFFGDAAEITVRAGARTGERLVLASPTAAGVEAPGNTRVVGADELRAGKRAWYHEEVGGRRFRVSAQSFFQARPDGAETLATLVRDAVGPDRVVADLYTGVGLFAALLDRPREVVAVDGDKGATIDAKLNLADLPARVVHTDVTRFRPRHFDVVIADPSRTGLRAAGVRVVAGCTPARVVLVSCDAAALARDTTLLDGAGYSCRTITLVDLFPHTTHVECVAVFDAR